MSQEKNKETNHDSPSSEQLSENDDDDNGEMQLQECNEDKMESLISTVWPWRFVFEYIVCTSTAKYCITTAASNYTV